MTTGLSLSRRTLVCSFAVGLFVHGTNVQAYAIRWRPVGASGNVICTPGTGDCGDTEIILSAGGVTVTFFVEVSGWDDDPDAGECTSKTCVNGGAPCFQHADCGDAGICADGSLCSVDAQFCADLSTCWAQCAPPVCIHSDPNACDGGALGPCAPAPKLGAYQATVDSETYIGGIAGNPGTLAGFDLWPVGQIGGTAEEGAFQALKVCGDLNCIIDPPACLWDPPSDCGRNPSSQDCEGAFPYCIDRPDFVFAGLDFTSLVSTSTADYEWAAASVDCAVDPDGGLTKFYGGTLLLEVPVGAAGTYNVSLSADPSFTALYSCGGPLFPGATLTPGQITIRTGRCCYGIHSASPGCEDGISEDDCSQKPQTHVFELGKTCAEGCPECLSDVRCSDPTTGQNPVANNLCTNDFCVDGECVFVPNYNVGVDCCNPGVGPPDGLTTIDDGDACTMDTCDADTGVVTHDSQDADGDGVCDEEDNCPSVPNTDQSNADGDEYGDACDGRFDSDHDGDVDLTDFADFVVCMSGPDVEATVDCVDIHDSGGGLRVDLADLAALQRVFMRSAVSP